MIADGRVVAHQSVLSRTGDGKVSRLNTIVRGLPSLESGFVYTEDGLLQAQWDSGSRGNKGGSNSSSNSNASILRWTYGHDADGNVVSFDFGLGNTSLEHGPGGRVVSLGSFNNLTYDVNGRCKSRQNLTFDYDPFGRLQRISTLDKTLVSSFFYYDDVDDDVPSGGPGVGNRVRVQTSKQDTVTYFYDLR